MKVLMTADTIGGVWNYALQLAGDLAAHSVTVDLATMGAPLTREQHAAAAAIPQLRLWPSDYKLEWMDDPWGDVRRAGDWLLELAEAVRPDVVHLNNFCHAALPWPAPALVVGHSCVLSWWEAVRGASAPAAWDHYRREVARGLRAAQLVVAPTRAMLNALDTHYGPLPASVVIPNARTAPPLPVAPKEPFILSVGRLWDEAKNVAALSRVAASSAWPIYVAGAQQHPEGGHADLGGLRPLGRIEPQELALLYNRAAIYALPARYEPFGLSALEAGLAGCALLLGDIASLREVWGDAALFVPPDDSAALKSALQLLIADPRRRAEYGRRARERALQYSPQLMSQAYLSAYSRLTRSADRAEERPVCVS